MVTDHCHAQSAVCVVVVVDDVDDDDNDDNGDDEQEELARKRQLPVPPMPRKGGVLARSEDNVSGGSLSLSWSSAWRSR